MRILVVNAGSSSLKLSLLDADELVGAAVLPMDDGRFDPDRTARFVADAGALDAVGHRIVHGGTDFTGPTLLDARVRQRLERLTDLAPLHQPTSLAALDTVSALLPRVPAVACFDTAFHATLPPAATTYALPVEWRRRWPLRRFGFHGLSHAYIARRTPELLERPRDELRIVSCHLGAGASVTAIARGRSVDTTMGFTPLEGLVMATRSGSVDPGLVLWLEQHAGMPPAELAATLEHRSGLLGLAGTADLESILDAEAAGDGDAALAVAVYLHRLRGAIAAMTAALGGLDVLAFTGGVGEHAAPIRARAAEGLGFLGVSIDAAQNRSAEPDCDVGTPESPVRTLVVRAREDLQIASEVEQVRP
jgi:acetate kinase